MSAINATIFYSIYYYFGAKVGNDMWDIPCLRKVGFDICFVLVSTSP